MATRTRQTSTEDPKTDDPPDSPDDQPKGDGLTARIDAIEDKLTQLLDGTTPKPANKPETRTQKESATREQIKEEMAALRQAEAEEKGRSELVAKVEKLEKSLKVEKPPEIFSKIAKAFFPSGRGGSE